MKTGTVFVLLAFIVMGLEVAWAQVSLVKGEGAEGTPADSREGSEPSVRPEGGFPGSNQVPTAEWGLALIRCLFFDLNEHSSCVSHSPYQTGLGLLRNWG